MSHFWQQLNKPFFCLAPMEEVTDVVFREMFARYSKPDRSDKSSADRRRKNRNSDSSDISYFSDYSDFVMFTEFVNVDGLLHPEGFKKLKIDLEYTDAQRPIVAQLWGSSPDKFYQAARLVAEMGFDGVDINMGCPQSKEIGIGACAALIRNPSLAKEIIEATKKGVGDLPVSVKTRLGYSKTEEMEGWVRSLLECDIAALTLHARTKQEMSKVPAHWEKIKEAVEIRDKMQEKRDKDKTLIIGNGDVKSYQECLERLHQTGCDGVMVGRGAFGAPWFFMPRKIAKGEQAKNREREWGNNSPSIRDRLSIMLEHAELFDQKLGGLKSFVIMRKHFKAYVSGFEGAAELRAKLMVTKNLSEVREITKKYLEGVK